MTTTITPAEFVKKWSQIQQKETAVSQSHFNDVCALVGHQPPLAHDPSGDDFSFETQTVKPDGAKGFADVFYRGKFIWEYKGPHKDLDKAYQQLQLYREALENPPLLITSDIHTIIIHTNFNNYPIQRHTITFDDILKGDGVKKLTWAFLTPERFRPEKTRQRITKATADSLLRVADEMKKHRDILGQGDFSNEQLAHFLVRLLFAMFAQDMKLLPDNVFTKIMQVRGDDYDGLKTTLRELFSRMRSGGPFGLWPIRHFNGSLFDDDFVPDVPHDLGRLLLQAAEQDWSQVDPSIFGTLFERVIDENKRAQLGAHYTSEDDIMLIVEPVLMAPLKRKWDSVRQQVRQMGLAQPDDEAQRQQAHQLLCDFAAEIGTIRLLDPSCGSGNFLYVGLRELLNLQKEVISFAARQELPPVDLTVAPEQLYGIEINTYAHELAQITVWIGYLQWRHENGFTEIEDPVLRPLQNIKRMDAILAYDDTGNPIEPEWPEADVIIGNPPFVYKIRQELGDETVNALFELYDGRVPHTADLVVYWFERAWAQITQQKAKRAGLIATQAIRSPINRRVLEKITTDGGIFMAWSDKPWALDGAAVRVSLIGFDDGHEQNKLLDGQQVAQISSDLTSGIDLTQAKPLAENKDITFQGSMIGGPFQISEATAQKWLKLQNASGYDNADVLRPYVTGIDVLRQNEQEWIVDFGPDLPLEEAKKYEKPFQHVRKFVYPQRQNNRRTTRRERWWIHADPQPAMREAIANLQRYAVTVRVAKHRTFAWLEQAILCSNKLIVFAREDDYFFGLLHSKIHEVWSLAKSSRHGVGNDPTYTPTTTFETFPFPWPPGSEPDEVDDPRVAAISQWSRALVNWRDQWLNPPRDTFYGNGIGTAYEAMVKKRTLTNLYNGLVYYRQTVKAGHLFDPDEFAKVTRQSVSRNEIQALDDINAALDRAVLDAYGWPHSLTDEQILERLLALNLQRAAT